MYIYIYIYIYICRVVVRNPALVLGISWTYLCLKIMLIMLELMFYAIW